jgi:uncharacterized protein involved in response to NO
MRADHIPVPRYRRTRAPTLLKHGFRPFFLAAGLHAGAAMGYWMLQLSGTAPMPPSPFGPIGWHTHEMLFGFAGAAIAGFLLTAIPNWTGRMPLQGGPLALLVVLWAVGRGAVWGGGALGPWWVAALDLAFPLCLLAAVLREILAGRNRRNLPVTAALGLFTLANAASHAEAAGWRLADGVDALGRNLGLAVLVLLIALIGGRITPSFTRNWLAKRGAVRLPAPFGPLDGIALGLTLAALILILVAPGDWPAAVASGSAALALAVRLARWRGLATAREPMLLVVGFALAALAAILPSVPPTAAAHAFGVGAVGTMILAVMSRATLGHTGATPVADRWTTLIYGLIQIAALARLTAVLAPAWTQPALSVAGFAWIAAFGGFVLLYGPRLAR